MTLQLRKRLWLVPFIVILLWMVSCMRSVGRGFRRAGLGMQLSGAVYQRDLPQTQALLDQGADPNYMAENEANPLALALFDTGDKAMVRLLLKHGASPSAALMQAGTAEQAKIVIEMGADVNARVGDFGEFPPRGTFPLMHHSLRANVEMVRFLLAQGADPTLTDAEGKTTLERVEYVAERELEYKAQYAAIAEMLKQAVAQKARRSQGDGKRRHNNRLHRTPKQLAASAEERLPPFIIECWRR